MEYKKEMYIIHMASFCPDLNIMLKAFIFKVWIRVTFYSTDMNMTQVCDDGNNLCSFKDKIRRRVIKGIISHKHTLRNDREANKSKKDA